MSAAQVGKSECLLNTIGRTIDRDPAPILFIMPTTEMAQAMSKDRIAPMIRDTPALEIRLQILAPGIAVTPHCTKCFQRWAFNSGRQPTAVLL